MNKEINPGDYVVLDVETNGQSSIKCDLLSISIYDPLTSVIYNRFLPLEINDEILTSDINGISLSMLENEPPLSQDEINELIQTFNLNNRTILTYGGIDQRFINAYCKRHNLSGFEKLHFFNFKQLIISSKFSAGNITKDNLCNLFKIDNVTIKHSSKNDCILEWNLFTKIYDKPLLITECNVFEMNDSYIIPASYIEKYPNLKYYRKYPEIYITTNTVKHVSFNNKHIERFDTNINGISIENIINKLLNAEKIDNSEFELTNKMKLKFLGKLPTPENEISIPVSSDDKTGLLIPLNSADRRFINTINENTKKIKLIIQPLIKYIKKYIFNNEKIYTQELIINQEYNVSCRCDFSNKFAVLEVKTGHNLNFESIKNQLYFESNNRPVYVLYLDWDNCSIAISRVKFISKEEHDTLTSTEKTRKSTLSLQNKIENKDIEVIKYINSLSNIELKCKKCGFSWSSTYKKFMNYQYCPKCNPVLSKDLVDKSK